ncbi:MAG: hypothetical protein QNJ54_31845 [Prochloraceae cyanobacterium]|nr:hypothetical protein [Prochloraceae cyanobacterium]
MNRLFKLLFSLLQPKPQSPTIESYGQTNNNLPDEQIKAVMEWLFASLLNAGYKGRAHVIWYDDTQPDSSLKDAVRIGIWRDEPTFLYRCGNRVQSTPDGYYWRMMNEHPSTRIYQLEVSSE